MKAIIVIILILLLMHACQSEDHIGKESYFAGTVLAEYHKVHRGSDSFTVTFYEKGTYKVTFAQTPPEEGEEECLYCAEQIMPKAFTITVTELPASRVIYQHSLPNRLRVTITRKGEKEMHDF